ncbi:MAG: tetratricopeptide repeat protein [Bacteroidales bacterium]|nr:tetratricopeptide repeat protein [Bacteroidales bacterium]
MFVFLYASRIDAQNQQAIDSLLFFADQSDTENRIKLYLEIADLYLQNTPELSLKYCNEAEAFSKSLNTTLLEAESIRKKGIAYLQLGKLNLAEQSFSDALFLCEKNKYKKGIAENKQNLGVVYFRFGYLDKAINNYEDAWLVSQEISDTALLISTSISIGNVWMRRGNDEETLHYLNRALVLAENSKGYLPEKGRIYNNLGVFFSENGKNDKSLTYYQKAVEIYDSIKSLNDLGKLYNNIGTIYLNTEDYTKAKEYYLKSLLIRTETKDITGKAYVLNNLGMLSGNLGDLNQALTYFEESFTLFNEIEDGNGSLLTTYNLGEVHMALGQNKKAEKYYHQGLLIAHHYKILDYELAILESLTSLYKSTREFHKAVEVFERSNFLTDSVEANVNNNKLIEMEVRFDQEKKRATLELLQKQVDLETQKSKRLGWITAIVALFFVLLIGYILFLIRKHNSKYLVQKYQLSQQFLQYQMNPGFLHQSFNYIRDFLYKNKAQEAGIYFSNFARLIRTFIEHSTSEKIDLNTELETIEHYFKIRRSGSENAFTYEIDINEKIETEFVKLPPFLLFPFFDIVLGKIGLSDTVFIKLIIDESETELFYTAEMGCSGNHFNNNEDLKAKVNTIFEGAIQRIDLIYKLNKQKIHLHYHLDFESDAKKISIKLRLPFT